ncbi:MAG TPA: DUF1810 domain-containing protein [Polyangiaceae bacterium]|nr:DUF1810 domain-containing protein [Polyangiaceae bacterium]
MFDLDRFEKAQDPVIETVLRELRAGHKQTHWMWFVFPQLRGLGYSQMARHYGIESGAEARAYLEHAVLGARLEACTQCVLAVTGRSAHEIFGSPDDLKLRSCMTLFAVVAPERRIFAQVIDRYFAGESDEKTLELLKSTEMNASR